MAVRFGEWLIGNGSYTREELSPVHQNYAGLAPVYLQGGGREILIDMIRDFARAVAARERGDARRVADMTHEFHVHGLTRSESAMAFQRIHAAMDKYTHAYGNALARGQCEVTEICNRIDV